MQKWQCKWASSLGNLEASHQEIWGTDNYIDQERPTVFMGLYGLPDFFALWQHKGEKHILWCGSDIRHFRHGYWLDKTGEIRLDRMALTRWINENCTSWVENEVEYEALKKCGIESKIQPSFLGDVKKFDISYKWSEKPKVYSSVSGNDFDLYGWHEIEQIAKEYTDIEFHLYGNSVAWHTGNPNVIVHGRVPKEQMNAEIKEMQGALRMVAFDGFSEILAKSVLMGQYPVSLIKYPHISLIKYPHMLSIDELGELKNKKEPNIAGREYYIKNLNNYPWNVSYGK